MKTLPIPKEKTTIRMAGDKTWTKTTELYDLKQMVLDRVMPEPNSGCWLWTMKLNTHGYGDIKLAGDYHISAHRLSYNAFKGDSDNLLVCHKCDTPACCNPDHLFLGTYKDNMQDMVNKKRSAWHKRAQLRAKREAFHEVHPDAAGGAS